MERSVNKLTSKTLKPLKPKHVQYLTAVSTERGVSVSEIFRCIHSRLREPNWVVVFKSLILVHILVREGGTDRVLGFLASNSGLLNMAAFRDRSGNPLGAVQAKNIRAYAVYLEEKVVSYREMKYDFVRSKPEMIVRFRSLPVEQGLLNEVELLQRQINALLGCTFYLDEIDNVVTLQSFRLLVGDMMALFHLLNEAVIRILGEYFEMTKSDATKALQIYKNFAIQTGKTVEFFEIARKLRGALNLDVPVFKHAPVSLAGALEDYLRAPDFEAQRLAYKEKKAAKNHKPAPKVTGTAHIFVPIRLDNRSERTVLLTESQLAAASTTKREASPERPPAAPAKALEVDFFASLDEELNAFASPSVQAQFNNADLGALWNPASPGNPFAAQQSFNPGNPFAAMQQQQQNIHQQVFDVSNQLATFQMGLLQQQQQASAGQLALVAGGFPLMNQQQQQMSSQGNGQVDFASAFGGQAAFGDAAFGGQSSPFGGQAMFQQQPQQQQQSNQTQNKHSSFTIENVFGNQDVFAGMGNIGGGGMGTSGPFGGSGTGTGMSIGGGGPAPGFGQATQHQSNAGPKDEFAVLAQSAFQQVQGSTSPQVQPTTGPMHQPSANQPVLDPFGRTTSPAPFGQSSPSQQSQQRQGSASPQHTFALPPPQTPFGSSQTQSGGFSQTPFSQPASASSSPFARPPSPQRNATTRQPTGIFANAGNYVATSAPSNGGLFAPVSSAAGGGGAGGAGPFGSPSMAAGVGVGSATAPFGGAGQTPFGASGGGAVNPFLSGSGAGAGGGAVGGGGAAFNPFQPVGGGGNMFGPVAGQGQVQSQNTGSSLL
ncbi:hypothetical protein HK104_004569 [Borealophlyctis nickersoniae]|nr:hypothetical protein HK104_004569 [Borealophlyctis nickersoniae]